MPELTVSQLVAEMTRLRSNWDSRNAKFKQWYDLLLMKDELAEENMESFVANDPKTLFNLSAHLLNSPVPHRIPTEDISEEELNDTGKIEKLVSRSWLEQERRYRRSGKKSWMQRYIGLLLATGWRSIFYYATNDALYADVWSPAEVFPEYDEDGMSRCLRAYSISPNRLKSLLAKNKWTYNRPITSDLALYNYWTVEDGRVFNTVVVGDVVLKPKTPEPDFTHIPILTGPVSGLPDEGIIGTFKEYQEHIGESVLAPNEIMFLQNNKNWTFTTQLMRDTATPRWFERSTGDPILKAADLFKRGAIFRGGPNDSIDALQVPPMPVELRTTNFDIQSMLQRGGFPWAMWANIQGAMSGYMMSQVAAVSQQVLKYYHDAIQADLADIDNEWVRLVAENGYKPWGMSIPKSSPKYHMVADYSIKIPGDLVQRATVARMVNPDFRLCNTTTADLFFPEITNPSAEQAKVRNDISMQNPVTVLINTVSAYLRNAGILRKAGDETQAKLYEDGANMLLSQISPQTPQQSQPTTGLPRPEAAPRQSYEPQIPPELQ